MLNSIRYGKNITIMKPTVKILFWNVSKATRLVEDILEELQHDVESVLLITACDREFEVDVNGELIFSKKLLDRHGNDGEIIKLIKDKM